jgi:hypothetical protein
LWFAGTTWPADVLVPSYADNIMVWAWRSWEAFHMKCGLFRSTCHFSLHNLTLNLQAHFNAMLRLGCDVLQVRLGAHAELVDIAERAGVPIINGGTDCNAPCQVQQAAAAARWHDSRRTETRHRKSTGMSVPAARFSVHMLHRMFKPAHSSLYQQQHPLRTPFVATQVFGDAQECTMSRTLK